MTQNLFDLRGKNALITGGTHGLGMAMAFGLAEAGATLIINGHTPGKLESAKSAYAKKGITAHTYLLDVTDESAVENTIPIMEKEVGPIHILVNNAAIIKRIPILEMKAKDFREILDVNLTGQFIMAKTVAQGMVERGNGKIINICSLFSFLGGQWSPAYAATKHGLAGFTKAYCDELAQHNIQVNGIAPGYYATAITEKTRSNPETSQRVLDHIPANRWGETMDLMGSTIFLASRASDYVNGHILVVDGGYMVR